MPKVFSEIQRRRNKFKVQFSIDYQQNLFSIFSIVSMQNIRIGILHLRKFSLKSGITWIFLAHLLYLEKSVIILIKNRFFSAVQIRVVSFFHFGDFPCNTSTLKEGVLGSERNSHCKIPKLHLFLLRLNKMKSCKISFSITKQRSVDIQEVIVNNRFINYKPQFIIIILWL